MPPAVARHPRVRPIARRDQLDTAGAVDPYESVAFVRRTAARHAEIEGATDAVIGERPANAEGAVGCRRRIANPELRRGTGGTARDSDGKRPREVARRRPDTVRVSHAHQRGRAVGQREGGGRGREGRLGPDLGSEGEQEPGTYDRCMGAEASARPRAAGRTWAVAAAYDRT